MKILQVLPELNSGGVERGTVEFARELAKMGHESWVLSNGGELTSQLHAQGSQTIELPIHRKSLVSLKLVRPVRQLLRELQPDIVHVRSRLPAWVVWLAWRKLPLHQQPGLVSTFHGNYSVNAYSAIMTRAERLIAISDNVAKHMTDRFKVAPEDIKLIHRGVDIEQFQNCKPNARWFEELYLAYPNCKGKDLIVMPGRLTFWKGHEEFFQVMAEILKKHPHCHGLVVGNTPPHKAHFFEALKEKVLAMGLDNHISFLGYRSDMPEIFHAAKVVCHFSTKPEPFGRVIIEALATNTPVVAFNHGGAAEVLGMSFPLGLVPVGHVSAASEAVLNQLNASNQIELHEDFLLSNQVNKTLAVYEEVLANRALIKG